MGVFNAKCLSPAKLAGKTVIVTGCNTGIGKCTVQDLYQRGAKVLMACRNLDAAKEARNDIIEQSKTLENLGEIKIIHLDLSDFESVRKCAREILDSEDRIDILINNAAVMMCPKLLTKDGFEMQFGTNHLGHFLFTMLLLPKIKKSESARIINVSSNGHKYSKGIDFEDINYEKKRYSALSAYADSKLANVLFTKALAKRLKDANVNNVNVYTLHPGVVGTDLGRHLNQTYFSGLTLFFNYAAYYLSKTPMDGAQTTIYCAVDEKCANETGLYYSECKVNETTILGQNEELADKLWEFSAKLVHLDANSLI